MADAGYERLCLASDLLTTLSCGRREPDIAGNLVRDIVSRTGSGAAVGLEFERCVPLSRRRAAYPVDARAPGT